jgi:hypothetical protein
MDRRTFLQTASSSARRVDIERERRLGPGASNPGAAQPRVEKVPHPFATDSRLCSSRSDSTLLLRAMSETGADQV